jgi:hypothetical protein
MITYKYKNFSYLKLELLSIKKKNNIITITDFWGYQDRNSSMINLIKSIPWIENVKDFKTILLNTWDKPINRKFYINILSFCSKDWYKDIVIPDFVYDAWKDAKIESFENEKNKIISAWKEKPTKNLIWWVWNCNSNSIRWKLFELWEKNKNYLDIRQSYVADKSNKNFMSLEELVSNYKFLIDIEWRWYSGRLKLLLFSWRPIFIQDRDFKDFTFKFLKPYKNYIPIKNDLSDLVRKCKKYFNNDKLIEKIAKNWKETANKFFTKEAALKMLKQELNNLQDKKFNESRINLFILCWFIFVVIAKTINLLLIQYLKLSRKIAKKN